MLCCPLTVTSSAFEFPDIQHRFQQDTISMSWQPGPHGIPKFINFEKEAIVTGGTFNQQNHIDNRQYTFRNGENAGYATLLDNVATAAMHDSIDVVDPPKCHPNTRVAIMQSIIDWSKGVADEEINQKSMIWLNGGAGAGKSAIARSVAERCSEQGLLLGSFFFAAGDATRNHIGGLVATLCYQMCRILPGFRDMVSPLIANDPLVFRSSISTQLITLLFDPFCRLILAGYPGASTTWIPRLIIIDGLDECSETRDQKNLLLALQEAARSTTLIRFLICSRPENHINAAFGLPRMAYIFYKIFLGDDYRASKDIRQYLEDKFTEIKEGHVFKHTLPAAWPTCRMIDELVYKSSGQFIYASTVIRYINSPKYRPHQRLEAIFNLREPEFKDLPFTQLDALYRHIISKAEDLFKVLDILAFPALYGFFPVKGIEVILDLQEGDVEIMLADLHSIVEIVVDLRRYMDGTALIVRFLHKSLVDFLSDPQRAGTLYCEFSAVRRQHVARVISIYSARTQGLLLLKTSVAGYRLIIPQYGRDIEYSLIKKPVNYVSYDILQAVQQFPMFEFIKGPLFGLCGASGESDKEADHHFLASYFEYLFAIKDVSEETSLVYVEQKRQFCDCVLSMLESNFSDDWGAHLCFAFWYLLPAVPQLSKYRPRWGFVNIATSAPYKEFPYAYHRPDGFTTGCSHFAWTIFALMFTKRILWSAANAAFSETVYEISHQLTKGLKKKVIFAKSAAFCLAFLCDEGSTALEARHISRVMGIDQRKRRERPWRWGQSSHRRSLHNRLVVVSVCPCGGPRANDLPVLTRLGKAGKLLSWEIHPDASVDSDLAYWGDGTTDHQMTPFIYTMREYIRIRQPQSHGVPLCKLEDACREREHYLSLLDLLPWILSLSGRYEPLVTMCRKKSFASLSLVWPKQTRRARQAMERYLQRVDSEENI
ncbi:hypothetical protein D9613_009756 [Agrocybe pediades]|uniref:Nephrocystin 3-like N-terminal domain-containing protein n=1 Tax=Agrocybe pediades TaxID=84607 RepID=A0A8H4QXP8_9AGAR|nr:hypothetical protein D9613_009756 [Agrocybe pediades]